jgi:hypothetical protein
VPGLVPITLTGVDHIWWPAERLLQERIATLQELETYYSIDDIMDRNDALDAVSEGRAKADAQARADAEAERQQQ